MFRLDFLLDRLISRFVFGIWDNDVVLKIYFVEKNKKKEFF